MLLTAPHAYDAILSGSEVRVDGLLLFVSGDSSQQMGKLSGP